MRPPAASTRAATRGPWCSGSTRRRCSAPPCRPSGCACAWRRPRCHPLLRHYLATGDLTPQQVADVPSGLAGPRARAQWAELSRCHGIEHQLAIPLPPGTEGMRWFVLGRPDAVQRGTDAPGAAGAEADRRAGPPGGRVAAVAAPRPGARRRCGRGRHPPHAAGAVGAHAGGRRADRGAVARRLLVAERTVHKHLERAYAKLGVSDRVSAVLRAQRLGILPEPALAMAR